MNRKYILEKLAQVATVMELAPNGQATGSGIEVQNSKIGTSVTTNTNKNFHTKSAPQGNYQNSFSKAFSDYSKKEGAKIGDTFDWNGKKYKFEYGDKKMNDAFTAKAGNTTEPPMTQSKPRPTLEALKNVQDSVVDMQQENNGKINKLPLPDVSKLPKSTTTPTNPMNNFYKKPLVDFNNFFDESKQLKPGVSNTKKTMWPKINFMENKPVINTPPISGKFDNHAAQK